MNVRCVAFACALPFVAAAHADPQRDQIATERAAANAKFDEQRKVCQTRFVVASCTEAARKEQQATLARLRRLELEHDEAKRREATAARERELSERATAQQSRASDAAEAERPERVHTPSQPKPPLGRRSTAGDEPTASKAATAEERSARERRNEQAFDERTRAALAHREEVERRNAERAAHGKMAAPLPVPSGASAP